MTKQSKLFVGVGAAVLLIVALIAFFALRGPSTPDGPGGGDRVVQIGTFSTAIDYAPFIIAQQKGWLEEALEEQGAEFEPIVYQSLAPITESLAAGRVDVMFMAEPPVLISRASGVDINIVGMSASLPQEILVPSGSGVQSVADLGGKRVAVLAGSSSNYSLVKMARAEGIDESDFEIVDMIPPDAKPAFRSGAIDAWAVWSPWVEQEVIDGTGRVIPGSDAQVHSIIAMRGEFVDAEPELADAIVQTIERARTWILENPEEAKSIVAEELGLDRAVVDMAWKNHDWSSQITSEVTTDIQQKADFLLEKGFIRESVNVASDVMKPL